MTKTIANWGNYPRIQTEEFSYTSAETLRTQLLGDHLPGISRGNGRSYGDASLAQRTYSSLSFDHVLAFDPVNGVFECESGLMLDSVLEIVVPKGWFLPVSPGTKYITVGGAVASDIHGKNHHLEGSFCNHLMAFDIMLASGEIVTCTQTQNIDLFEATQGGMGLTGIILTIKFKLKKIQTSFIRQTQIKATNLTELFDLFFEHKSNTYSMAWIDCLKSGKNFGRSILMVGEHATTDQLSRKQRENALQPRSDTLFSLPANLPPFVLNEYSVKAFNYLFYKKNVKKTINNIVPYDPFFYPLDKILKWNRMYGRKGFLQYQFVLPMSESKRGMTEILTRINKKSKASFLAVFKVFGKQNKLISFTMEGCTLALDFPLHDALFPFLDELDQIVLDYGGRLYLTKDARMTPDTFWASYPGASRFYQIVKRYNPNNKFRSLQSDRLSITS